MSKTDREDKEIIRIFFFFDLFFIFIFSDEEEFILISLDFSWSIFWDLLFLL